MKEIDELLRSTTSLIHTENIAIEAVRDLVKDEIKKYIIEINEKWNLLQDECPTVPQRIWDSTKPESFKSRNTVNNTVNNTGK